MSVLSKEAVAAAVAKSNREPQRPAVDPIPRGVTIRTGEDILGSRPLYISKAAAATAGKLDRSLAKHEMEFSDRLKKSMIGVYGAAAAHAYPQNSVLVPLSWQLLPEEVTGDGEYKAYRKAFSASVEDLDPEMVYGKSTTQVIGTHSQQRFLKTAMSYINQQTGGALVAPPQFGDLIEILRNKAVMPNIGARNVALPPQGSIQYPRQTGVTTFSEKPENTSGDESNPTFDTVTLEPKQFIGLVRVPNQLLTFAPGLAEAAIREDMAEQIALTFDLACLQGNGGPNRVRGLINQTGITTVVAKQVGTNGNTWTPPDTARIIRAAMARNSDVKTFVMRPDMWLGITESRADAVTPGDSGGQYLFNMLREFGSDFGETLRQRKVVTSNQISQARDKGSASDLTYILGLDGQEVLVGMHGAMVLDANPYETTAYASNQTLMRSIMFGDLGVRRGAGVVFMDDLIVPNLDA